MTKTDDLISELTAQALPAKAVAAPAFWAVRLLVVLAVYSAVAQCYLNLRPDLEMQFTRPFFVAEIALLLFLLISSSVAALLAMYPDAYQKPQLLKLPFAAFALLVGLLGFQLLMPHDSRMVIPQGEGVHAMECAICIASVALLPAAIIFAIMRKGASVRPLQAGSFAVLAATAVAGLTIRIAEANDSIEHLVQWHYIPTLLFAALGALVGKWLLKW
jgi:hypothetical protein